MTLMMFWAVRFWNNHPSRAVIAKESQIELLHPIISVDAQPEVRSWS
jgi:hypothetical protein